jgi:8-oxo-dGTP diphosphatase
MSVNLTAVLPAAAAVIFDAHGRVLLQRRRDAGTWGLLGGHVEFGETVEQTVLREIREEAGVAARLTRFIGVYSDPASQTYSSPAHGQRQYVTCYFEAVLLEPLQADFTNEETQELCFFPLYALPPDLAQLHPHWLADALSERPAVVR